MSTTTALPVIRTCRSCKAELQSGLRGRPRVYCTTCRPPHRSRTSQVADDGLSPAKVTEALKAGLADMVQGSPDEDVDLFTRARLGRINRADVAELLKLGRSDLILLADREGRIDTEVVE